MKVQRTGVFETNSSSTHAISISLGDFGNSKRGKLPVDEKGICRIFPGQFGWEKRNYTDAATKASYCLTACWSCGADEKMLKRVVRDNMPDANDVVFVGKPGPRPSWDCDYYIDHQSSDVHCDAFESDETLTRFIFSKRSHLYTGNDNE